MADNLIFCFNLYMDKCSFSTIVDSLPIIFIIADKTGTVMMYNVLSKTYFSNIENGKRFGDTVKCVNAKEAGYGFSTYCSDCVIRKTVENIEEAGKVSRKKVSFTFEKDGKPKEIKILLSAVPVNCEGKNLVALSIEDIDDLVKLRGIIPICSLCKKIRNDKNYWLEVENYIKINLDEITFSHGICPTCLKKHYPDFS